MKKLVSIDYMRALSAIYIVAFWHLMEYVKAIPEHAYKNHWTGLITVGILGLFVFISGYLSGGRRGQALSPLEFYRKRLLRIYPLYALAIYTFYLFGINGSKTSLISLFGLSMYYGSKPITLWFITMIVVFYMLAPFFLKWVDRPLHYFSVVGIFFAGTVGLYTALGTVDIRLLMYLPCYAAGLYCSVHGVVNRVFNLKSMMFVFGLGLPLLNMQAEGLLAPNRLGRVPIILALAYLTFYAFYRNERFFQSSRFVTFLSYGSFAMYLFHRPIYSVVTSWYMPEGNWQVLYMLGVFAVFVTTISWALQKAYDLVLAVTSKPKASAA